MNSREEYLAQAHLKVGSAFDQLLELLWQGINSWYHHQSLPSRSDRFGKGVILYGVSGVGKTYLANTVAGCTGLPTCFIPCSQFFLDENKIVEQRLHDVLTTKDPLILILDDLEVVASDFRWMATLASFLELPSCNSFVIGTTTHLQRLPPEIKRSGRLDEHYLVNISKSDQRYEILRAIGKDMVEEGVWKEVSQITHGFSSADLQSLCVEACLLSKGCKVLLDHFKKALEVVKPSGLREYEKKLPKTSFSSLFGLDQLKEEILNTVMYPLLHPDEAKLVGISPPKGILVHGPSGVGKTVLCSSLAKETGINFVHVDGTEIRSKFVGKPEETITSIFEQARSNSPCILFIDQIDSIAIKRSSSKSSSENSGDRIVTCFLTELDGVFSDPSSTVLLVGATNNMKDMDPAFLRPGRMEHHFFIDIPSQEERQVILKGYVDKSPNTLSDADINTLAKLCQNMSGADLENLWVEAAMTCLREDISGTNPISFEIMLRLLKQKENRYFGNSDGELDAAT